MSNSNDRKRVKVSEDLLNGLRNDHPHSDVKIILDDGEIEASKFVLSSRSEYFDRMFDNDHQFKESQENVVTVPCKKIIMKKVIEYLYGVELNIDGLAMVDAYEYIDLLRLMMLEEALEVIERKHYRKINYFGYPPTDFLAALDYLILKNMDHDAFHIAIYITEEENLETILKDYPKDIQNLSKTAFLMIMEEGFESTEEINKFRFFKNWFYDEKNLLFRRKLAKDNFDLFKFKVEELLGEVKKSKLFNDFDIDNAVMKVHKDLERKMKVYREVLDMSD